MKNGEITLLSAFIEQNRLVTAANFALFKVKLIHDMFAKVIQPLLTFVLLLGLILEKTDTLQR
jgi:hypothetical protein